MEIFENTDKTSLKADREVEGGGRGGANGISKLLLFAGVSKHSGTNDTGGHRAEIDKIHCQINKSALGPHQGSPELTQEAPQTAYELAEPLFMQFRLHGPSQGGRARARGRTL